MKRTFPRKKLFWLASLSLLICCLGGILLDDRASANSANSGSGNSSDSKLASDLRDSLSKRKSGDELVSVIVQLNGPMSSDLNAFLNSNGVHLKANFKNLSSMFVELPVNVVDKLVEFEEVAYVTPDRDLQSDGHVSQTSGAASRRVQTASNGSTYTLDGTGVGIAILDSGIYTSHKSFTNDFGNSRIAYSKDFGRKPCRRSLRPWNTCGLNSSWQ
jgi:subtilisin family serine protease